MFNFRRDKITNEDKESLKRLVPDESPEEADPPNPNPNPTPRTRFLTALTLSLAITNIATLALWISTLNNISSWQVTEYPNRPKLEYLGAAKAPIEYETRRYHTGIVDGDVTEFFGAPGTKADQAWNRILDTGLLRLTPDQANQLSEATAQEWNATDSYVGILGTFHQLHCLSRLRYTLFYPDRFEDFDGEGIAKKHILHCIEYLRETITCQADVTIEPVGFNETTLTYIAAKDQVRQCRNFETIYGWARSGARAVPDAPGNRKAWEDMLRFKSAHPVGSSRVGS